VTKVLRPAGFLGRRVPHTGYERLAHVPYEALRISAAGGDWLALPDPSAGRMRGDTGGTVITMSSGAAGNGFALCLCCGRAVAEASSIPGEPAPDAIRRHKPLAPPRGAALVDGYCPGGYRDPHRIQRHLRLGHEARTDVFEFQLPSGTTRSAALGIAAALREALADRLGVEAREIGVSAATTVGPSGESRVSALLFDRASGGAGLVTRLTEGDWFEAAVAIAAAKLDCREGCEAGCPACLLRPDLNLGDTRIDRPQALEAASAIRDRLRLPKALRLFGEETRMVGSPLAQCLDVLRARGRIRRLHLFLHGDPKGWDLAGWPAHALLPRLEASGIAVGIYAAADKLAGDALETAQKLDLHRLAVRGNAQLAQMGMLPAAQGGRPLLAVVETADGALGFAKTDDAATVPGPEWGSSAVVPVVQGRVGALPAATVIDLEKFLVKATGNSHLVWIRNELDGPAPGFGRRFWQVVAKEAPEFVARLKSDGIADAVYSDRYLQTPINIRLLFEILSTMPGRVTNTKLRIRSSQKDRPQRSSWAICHDFEEDGIRKAVIAELLGTSDVAILAKKQMPHARSLEIRLKTGGALRILLDQGLGAWRAAEDVRYEFQASPKLQATALRRLGVSVRMDHRQGSPVVLELG